MTQESEKKPARRVDDKLPGTSVDWSDAPRFNALGIAETWSVTVEAEGRLVLSIGHEDLASCGQDLHQFKETIRSCAMHLLGFIGASPIAATAAPAASPAPAAAGIEGLTRYVLCTDGEMRPVSNAAQRISGEFYYVSDVERLLGAHAAEPAKLTDERINELYEEATSYQLVDEDYAGVRLFVRAIEREVLGAHAGVVAAEPEHMSTDESREYLVKFMEQHFTDKTFHRYIRGEYPTRNNLAGDFAWQLARALRMPAAPAAQAPVQNAEEVRRAALEEAAKMCDEKFRARSVMGFAREASCARSLAEEIRAIASKEAAA